MLSSFLDLLGVSSSDVPELVQPLLYVIVGVICCQLLTTITGALLYLCGWRK